jgi:hypothetical protein
MNVFRVSYMITCYVLVNQGFFIKQGFTHNYISTKHSITQNTNVSLYEIRIIFIPPFGVMDLTSQ